MSSTLEEIDGNSNITIDLDEKESETKCSEEEVLVNGDGCMDHTNLNGDTSDNRDESHIVKAHNSLFPLNGITPGGDQELTLILAEHEHMKSELSQLQKDYRLPLEREESLSEKLKDNHGKEDSSVEDLSRVDEDLRKNLDTVLEELKSSKDELKRVKDKNDQLVKEKSNLTAEISRLQVSENEESETLRKANQEFEQKLQERTEELDTTKEKLQAHDQAAKRAIAALQKEMALRVDQVTKMYEDVLKEKENMGIKSIQGEEEKKKMARENELLARKVSENTKEIEKFRQKLKTMQTDHAKLQTAYDDKGKELNAILRESDKLTEEVNSQAVKVKWAQNKLKTELEMHKETKAKLAQVTQKLKESREEGLQIRADCQAMIKQYQESEEMKSNSLDSKLKAKEVELKRHEQEIADQDEVHKMKVQELETWKEQCKKSKEEVKVFKEKISELEEKIIQYALKVAEHEKSALMNIKEQQNLKKELEECQLYKAKYESEVEMVKHLTSVESEQKKIIADLEADILACHAKEAELLAFSQKMTAKNAQLQSEASGTLSKLDGILLDKSKLEEQSEQVEKGRRALEEELKEKTLQYEREIESLKSHLEEKSKAMSELVASLEESKDELQVVKRKNTALIKDLTRQLQQSRKQVEKLESNNLESKENLSEESKSSSTNSLDKIGGACTTPTSLSSPTSGASTTDGGWVVINGCQSSADRASLDVSSGDNVQILGQKELRTNSELEPNKAVLVERICRLQKIHAKKNEKLEFMEGHVAALVEEIQKKSRIIHYYVLREQAGTLAPPMSDLHKAQVSRHGGIMASVYSSKAVDPDMTLDLSLEINKKLQAVLEDTILKNITLKENLDTLGDEITRLNEELQKTRRSKRT